MFRVLVAAAVLLLAIGSANAQNRSAVEGGPEAPVTAKAAPATDPPADPPADPAAAAQAPAPDGFTVAGFTFKPGGRVKLDVIRDFNPITSEDSFDTRTIAVDGSEGTNSNIIAKETRLFLDMRGPVQGKELRMYVETDFYGTSSALRLRHAYGTYGGLLAGQTWSTFVDDANIPNTIDFESPTAFALTRQAELRWTQKAGEKTSWAVAVEDNKSSIQIPTNIPGKAEYPMPDLVGRVKFEGSGGHVFVSGFLGKARFRPTTGEEDNVTLGGGMVSAKLKTGGRDYGYGQITFGNGIGRYRGGVTAVPDTSGELHGVGLTAWMFGYEHFWSTQFSSNGVYSATSTPREDYYAASFNRRLDYGAVNLLYWFIPDRAWAGVEYLYGRREVMDGAVGTANRIQFAVRFNFPS